MSLTSVDDRPAPAPRKDTVFVVVDETVIRSVIAGYLRDCEYKVIEAANSDEALVVLRQPNIAVDVLFSDIEKAGSISGVALAQWVRAHRPTIEIVLTRTVSEAAKAAGYLCEHGPAMSKPYEPEAVVEKVRQLLDKRRS